MFTLTAEGFYVNVSTIFRVWDQESFKNVNLTDRLYFVTILNTFILL